jgi:hypothetical protein
MQHHSKLAALFVGLIAAGACYDEPAALNQVGAGPQLAKYGTEGFRTSQPAQAELLVAGELLPLATSGDYMPGSGERLYGVPDGIGSFGQGRYMQSYMNHEISGAARVSKFTIDTETGAIIHHDYTVDGSEGYSRLCSASWNDAGDGFPGGYFFTGEEQDDGRQLAIDRHGNVTELPHVGYYAHEQQVAVPGFRGKTVVVNFDDDGTSGADLSSEAGESELYMYVADDARGVLSGEGRLYVFQSDTEGVDDVGDLAEGQIIVGSWIPVPEEVVLDMGGGSKPGLDEWVDDPAHDAFDFTRLEDGFYDKVSNRTRGNPGLYFFDTGDPTLGTGGDGFWDHWGSIYRMEWADRQDPSGTTYLKLLARSEGPGTGWASPDNGDMNADGVIMLQEDRAAGPWTQDEARIFAFERASNGDLVDPAGTAVAQTLGSDCLEDSGGACWETSGIEDVSRWFGENAWLFDVQSKLPRADCPECVTDGQLLLIKVGGELGLDD